MGGSYVPFAPWRTFGPLALGRADMAAAKWFHGGFWGIELGLWCLCIYIYISMYMNVYLHVRVDYIDVEIC